MFNRIFTHDEPEFAGIHVFCNQCWHYRIRVALAIGTLIVAEFNQCNRSIVLTLVRRVAEFRISGRESRLAGFGRGPGSFFQKLFDFIQILLDLHLALLEVLNLLIQGFELITRFRQCWPGDEKT